MASSKKIKAEVLQFKSPAEFFAENQNIAGFDNAGKALYTTIREFVENSLDAAESAGKLPEIALTVEEMDPSTFNQYRELCHSGQAGDAAIKMLEGTSAAKQPKKGATIEPPTATGAELIEEKSAAPSSGKTKDDVNYYRITCKDNGCGMPHDKIPDMLGRVLSGSKYGVRQTRGKFGLGAKMALIWSKKSTGLPIEVLSAFSPHGKEAPAKVSFCRLDIDIYKNLPHVMEHISRDNAENHIGTEISVIISGAWSSYRARIMQYFQQLAVITPYAELRLNYRNVSNCRSNFDYAWRRRSTQIPRPPLEVKHHPSAVNDLLLLQLIDITKQRSPAATLAQFLTSQFQAIDRDMASDIIADIADRSVSAGTTLPEMNAKRIHALREAMERAIYPAPSGECLSPAGEYNLRLGIMKEIRPDLVATASSSVAVYQGHPFVVEAGVCLGGRGSEGLTVHRFANRIPLLFEGGGDVATQTATKRIPWGTYKIDITRDKVGVFVSLVSTKIPFKGTGKEYIGDDIDEIRDAVKAALQACCNQLRIKLQRASALKAKASRRKILAKYVPDVTRALTFSLKAMHARHEEAVAGVKRSRGAAELPESTVPGAKRQTLLDYAAGKLTESLLAKQLLVAVERADLDDALEQATSGAACLLSSDNSSGDASGAKGCYFIGPLSRDTLQKVPALQMKAFAIKFLPQMQFKAEDPAYLLPHLSSDPDGAGVDTCP